MSVLRLVRQNRRQLIILEIALFLAFAASLVAAQQGYVSLERTPRTLIGLYLLIPLAGTAIFYPLCWLAWFSRPRPAIVNTALKIFYWFHATAMAGIWIMIYARLVFR